MTSQQALIRLEDLCARAERCTCELQQKLRTWGIAGADARKIIDSLTERRFVDDVRFARAYAGDRVRFGRRGRLLVRRELMLKRIPADVIAEVLDDIDPDLYLDNLDHTLRAKLRQLTPADSDPATALADYDVRQKLLRHAVSRGYEVSLAASHIRQLASAAD